MHAKRERRNKIKKMHELKKILFLAQLNDTFMKVERIYCFTVYFQALCSTFYSIIKRKRYGTALKNNVEYVSLTVST